MYKHALLSSFNPKDFVQSSSYKLKNMRNNPNYFTPSGVMCFCGEQGAGKTYSAVKYVYNLMKDFPMSICCTNMDLFGVFDSFRERIVPYIGVDSFTDVTNDTYGVIFLIDELHLEFNSLESRNMPLSLFTEISQQRKQRKHIVGTSQLYSRLAKPFREQMSYVVACKCFLGLFQLNYVLDGWTMYQDEGKLSGVLKRRYFFFHQPKFYDSFDTFAKINRKRGGNLNA